MAGWDGWMASPTQWIWVWASSKSWWWTGRPGVLQSMRSQSQTQLSNWTELNSSHWFIGTKGFSLRSRKKSSWQLVLRHKIFNGFSEAFACPFPHLILKQFSGYSSPSKESYEWTHFRAGWEGSPTRLYSLHQLIDFCLHETINPIHSATWLRQ